MALATTLSFVLPLGEAADEVSHRAYVAEIAIHGRLPGRSGPASGEAFQPPLYYALAALLTSWLPNQGVAVQANPDFSFARASPPNLLLHTRAESFPLSNSAWAWHLTRLVSVCLGAVTVWGTWHIARESLPDEPAIAWAAAAFVAFLPGFLTVSAAVSNDSLIIALSTLIMWQWLRLLKQPPRPAQAALLGILLGLAAITKVSGFLLWGVSGLVFLWLIRDPATRWQWLRLAALAGILAISVSAPWPLYNLWLDGDVLAYSRMLSTTPRLNPMTLADWQHYVWSVYTSFWGRFGGATHIALPSLVYMVLGLLPVLAIVALFRLDRDNGEQTRGLRRLLALFLLLGSALLAAHIRLSSVLLGIDMARQLYPVLGALAVLLTLGARLTSQRLPILALLSSGMAAFALAFVVSVASTYAARPTQLSVLPPLDRQIQADFGNQIRLAGYRIEQQTIAPGQELSVIVHWQALAQPDNVYWLLLRLVDTSGPIATGDGVPAAGHVTTDHWQPGWAFASRHTLLIPPTATPGPYILEVGLHPAGRWVWLPVQGRDTLALGEITIR